MSMCRHFKGEPVERLIASVPTALVEQIDALMREARQHPARRCRSEYIRLALAEKLARDRRKLMISRLHHAREDVKVLVRVFEPVPTSAIKGHP